MLHEKKNVQAFLARVINDCLLDGEFVIKTPYSEGNEITLLGFDR